MEFLYFYVNAENPTWTQPHSPHSSSSSPVSVHSELEPQPSSAAQGYLALPDTLEGDVAHGPAWTAPSSPTTFTFGSTSPEANSTPPSAKSSPPQLQATTTPPLAIGTRRSSHRPTSSLSHFSLSTSPTAPTSQAPSKSTSPTSTPPLSTPYPSKTRPLQIQRKTSLARDVTGDGFATPVSTPKKAQPTREYPKTPRKALQPLNLQTRSERRVSRDITQTPVHAPVSGRVPSVTNAPTRPSLGHKRAQSQLNIHVSPRPLGEDGALPPLPPLPPLSKAAGNGTLRHKRAQSSLDVRRSPSTLHVPATPLAPSPHIHIHIARPASECSVPETPYTPHHSRPPTRTGSTTTFLSHSKNKWRGI